MLGLNYETTDKLIFLLQPNCNLPDCRILPLKCTESSLLKVHLQLFWNRANLGIAISTKNPIQSPIFESANFRI